MPGHGGALLPFDVTESEQTDNLLSPAPQGAIVKDEREAAELFGSRLTLFSAGGATLCLQTALAFQVSRLFKGARVFCERGVHRSILHALALLDVDPVFIPEAREASLSDAAQGDLVVFSGCDYFGRVPEYQALSAFLRARGLHSVVDNAHGTHLRFLSGGVLHPLTYGFELVVDSAHKTLSCLTGAALLHVGADLSGDVESLRQNLLCKMRLFSTSSPSFPILLSLTEALHTIKRGFDGENYAPFVALKERIATLAEDLSLQRVGQDPLRLSLQGNLDYAALAAALAEEGVVVELANLCGMVMLFSERFDENCAARLKAAFVRAQSSVGELPAEKMQKAPIPRRVLSLRQALCSESELVKTTEAEGRIAAEVVGLYPPGTALCMPGEILTRSVLSKTDATQVHVVCREEV